MQLFIAQGKEILVSGDDCVEEGVLGQGAYATVFQVKIRKQGHVSETTFTVTYMHNMYDQYVVMVVPVTVCV